MCDKHCAKIADKLGMKPLQQKTLCTALEQIYAGKKNAWSLKTRSETYHYFTKENRLPCLNARKELFRFQAEYLPLITSITKLWTTFQVRYLTAAATWASTREATIPGVLTWWWDIHHGSYNEISIYDVFRAEWQLYKYYLTRVDEASPSTMKYSLTQQLLRQDPELYQIAVTLRADGLWKLISVPMLANRAL